MEKKYDVIALGELLIDFTENGLSEQGNCMMEANPGGAPCNVLAMLNQLFKKTALIGKVGNDQFGASLKAVLDNLGIGTDNLYFDKAVHTTLAFVHTFEDGDRDFAFYRNPGADMMLTEDEVKEEEIKSTRIFHFGTLSMTHDGVRKATKKALKIAKDNGIIVSPEYGIENLFDVGDPERLRAFCVDELNRIAAHSFGKAETILNSVNHRLDRMPEWKQYTFKIKNFKLYKDIYEKCNIVVVVL